MKKALIITISLCYGFSTVLCGTVPAAPDPTVHTAQPVWGDLRNVSETGNVQGERNRQEAIGQFQHDTGSHVKGKTAGQTRGPLNLNATETGQLSYPWLNARSSNTTIVQRIKTPRGYRRIYVSKNSFKDWLRHLPLKKENSPVYLYNGKKKFNQAAHIAVVDIDVGSKDLQQCADAVIRLRAEYLYSIGDYHAIHFNFTSGDEASFTKWAKGYRPLVIGNKVSWRKTARPDSSYANFRKYLDTVFMYAGSYSLSKELCAVNIRDMEIGDVFIQGGFPGHVVIVVDMAINDEGKKLFLLAQSYTPAQDIHLLFNPNSIKLNPWYDINIGRRLLTPEWIFKPDQLKRFR